MHHILQFFGSFANIATVILVKRATLHHHLLINTKSITRIAKVLADNACIFGVKEANLTCLEAMQCPSVAALFVPILWSPYLANIQG